MLKENNISPTSQVYYKDFLKQSVYTGIIQGILAESKFVDKASFIVVGKSKLTNKSYNN